MAIKPNFLTSMGYHIFLTMVLRARTPSARAELRYNFSLLQLPEFRYHSVPFVQNVNWVAIILEFNRTGINGVEEKNESLSLNVYVHHLS